MALKTLEFSVLETIGSRSINGEMEHTIEDETDIHSIPSPILAEILTRVPAKTVFGCMTVSKPWLSAIDNSFFRKQHFLKSQICPLLIFDGIYSGKKLNPVIIMHLIEGECVSDFDPQIGNLKLNSRFEICKDMKCPRTKINGTFLRLNSKATSCEGVICSAPRHGGGRDHVIISNPITNEYVAINLFKCNRQDQDYVSVFIGLGFSQVDKKFKMLRISRKKIINPTVPATWFPEVCVVGTVGWERVEAPSIPQINFPREVEDVVYVNRAMYWNYSGDDSICCFDFDSNELRVLPLPEMNGVAVEANSFVTYNMHIGVLGGVLSLSLVSHEDGHVELWTIGKNGGNKDWKKILDIETEATVLEHESYLWTRGNYKAIKYLECGSVLMHDWRDTFLVYDPVTKNDKIFRVLDHSYINGMGPCLKFQVVPHLPNLVSLRDSLRIEDENFAVVKCHQRMEQRGRGAGLRRSTRKVGRGGGRGRT